LRLEYVFLAYHKKQTLMKHLISGLIGLVITFSLFGQSVEKHTISGTIADASNGETLIGANIFVKELGSGTVTNLYGFYSITLAAGTYNVKYSFVGFEPIDKTITLTENVKMDIELGVGATLIKEMVITGQKENANVESIEMSKEQLQMTKIKTIPAVFGEVDLIKAIQLLPGISSTGEGQSGFNVRGGSVDQNLILLDEAPVYNASHLLGFFSVFNPDAIKDVQVYKGGIPAEYGGRLSSVLDIRMKDGNKKKYALTGGIGTISSRLTFEGPIQKGESSFILSGRRTYADQFLRLAKDTSIRRNKAYFYDLNAKANFKLGENDRIFVSGYFGDDVFGGGDFGFDWGNATATTRWNHVYNDKIFSNLTFIYSKYDYNLGVTGGATGFSWKSDIQDYSAKLDYNFFINPKNTLKLGAITTYHEFNPGVIKGVGSTSIFNEFKIPENAALESAAYISNEQKITDKFSALYGLRYSHFNNVAKSNVYSYDENFDVSDTTTYEKNEFYNSYGHFEPRLGLKYTLSPTSSVKMSYNRMAQYVHLASNGISSSPLDIWFPSSKNVKPQIADQIAVGYFKNFEENTYEGSIEVYYKNNQNAIDFKDHAALLLNEYIEGELRFGDARAYGSEFLVRKNKGRLSGWLSYTLAKTERKIPEINSGEWYNATWDKTHDASLVLSYELSKRVMLSANWVYATGRAVTYPTGKFTYNGLTVPVYSDRNAERMPHYHRGDVGLTLKNKEKEGRKYFWDLNFSVYNVYNRYNAYTVSFGEDDDNPEQQVANKTYIFPILPALTWNFKL